MLLNYHHPGHGQRVEPALECLQHYEAADQAEREGPRRAVGVAGRHSAGRDAAGSDGGGAAVVQGAVHGAGDVDCQQIYEQGGWSYFCFAL